jgi:hypothetical protein
MKEAARLGGCLGCVPTHRYDLLQVILLCDVFVAHSNLQFSMKVCQLSMQLVWVDLKATRLMWAATCTNSKRI